MNDDIRVVKHNGDSGRMAENALRQRFDERTQLNEHHAADVLRDTDATTMQDVATQEQRQTNLIHFEEEPAYSSAYEEESDPFETIFAETGFEFPSGTPEREPDSNLKSEQREPLKETDLGVEGARAVAAKTFADQSGKPGLSTPENVGQEVFSTGGTLDSSPDFRTEQREYRSPEGQSRDAQNADANFVTNRHKVWDAAAYFPQSESGGQWTAYQPPQQQAPSYQQKQEYETADGLFQTIISEFSFGQDAPTPQTTQSVSVAQRAPDSGLRAVQRNADDQRRSAEASDPLAAMTAQRLVKKARQKCLSPVAGSDGIDLVTDRHKVENGKAAVESGRSMGSRSVPDGESRSAPMNVEDPLAMHTTQVLLDKARRKDRIDRMLNDNPEHNIDPDVVLKPSGDQPPGLLDAGAPEESARTPSASASRLLKGPAALLALGGRAAAGALLSSQLYEHQEGADADSQSILNAAKDGGRGVRTLRRGIRKLQRRRTTQRAAQTGRAAAQAADEAVKKAAENGGKKLFGAIAEGAKELLAAVGALVGGAVTPIIVVILALLMVIVMFMSIFTSMVGSPYGIFFVKEQQQELEFSTAISRITSSYFSKIYEREMSKEYESVEVNCEITDSNQTWREIVAVYAVDVCKQGLDAITMDEEHYQILKDVFWDKISISFSETSRTECVETVVREAHTETETHYYDPMGYEVPSPVAGGSSQTVTVNVPAEIEVSYVTYITLHINVREKSLDELKAARNLDEGEKKTVDDLLAENDTLWATLEEDFTNLIISGDESGSVEAIDVTAYATVGETVYRALIQEGYTPQAACGILGNIQQECSMNPRCVTGGAYGLCQWMGDRKANLMRLRGYSTASVQTGFMISELRSQTGIWRTYGGRVHYTYSGVHINSLSQFKHCTNVRAAAGAFCVCFERSGEYPGNQWYEARLNYASQWYRYAQSHWMGSR